MPSVIVPYDILSQQVIEDEPSLIILAASDEGHGETHSETGAHGAKEAEPFPPFDSSTFPSQLIWLALSFGLLYYLMARVALPRISNILEVRHDRIADDIAEAEKLKEETDKAIASYEQALAEARANALNIAQQTRGEIEAEINEKRAAIDVENAERMAEAEAKIEAMRAEALANVESIAGDTTEAIVSKLLGSSVSRSDVDSAVKTSLSNS